MKRGKSSAPKFPKREKRIGEKYLAMLHSAVDFGPESEEVRQITLDLAKDLRITPERKAWYIRLFRWLCFWK